MTQQKNTIITNHIKTLAPVVWGVLAFVATAGTIYGGLGKTVLGNSDDIRELKNNNKILITIRENQAVARSERGHISQDIKRIFNMLDRSSVIPAQSPHMASALKVSQQKSGTL